LAPRERGSVAGCGWSSRGMRKGSDGLELGVVGLPGVGKSTVLQLLAGSGTQFDPTVVKALFRIKGFSEAIPAQAGLAEAAPTAEPAGTSLAQAAGSDVTAVPTPPRRLVKRRPKGESD